MASNSTPRILDLTSLDREVVDQGYEKTPFQFKIKGPDEDEPRIITLVDPKELAWEVVVTMDETPRRFFQVAIPEADDRKFMLRINGDAAVFPLWMLQHVMEQYREHYGIDSQGNAVASRR